MVSELLRKYIWLVQTFIKEGDRGLSLDELIRKWEIRWGSAYSRRTFNNHREAVEDVFGIRIECNRSTMHYFIRYSEDVQDESADTAWLINIFTVNNLLSLGKERLSGRVSVEDIPSGQKYLTMLMNAMLDNNEIEIGYRKYTGSEAEFFQIQPYALKEFAKRWYLIGYCKERKALRVYGLDRILFIKVLDSCFPAGQEPIDIIFSATYKEAQYLRDLPIHHSQKEVAFPDFCVLKDVSEKVCFSIRVVPDIALIMELCRRGDRIEVLGPLDIRRKVAVALKKAAALYCDVFDNC